MDKQRVFVTRPIQPEAFELLEGHFHVEANKQDRLLDRQSLTDGVRDADGLLCLINDRIDREIIEAAGKLRIIANYGVGYDNIDIEAATQRGIVVTNTPGVLTDATADLVWALMFAVARRIVESDRFARAGMYESWSPTLLLGQEIRGKRLGIIGAGRIGRAVAKRSRGFDMEVVYTGRTRNIAFELEMGAIWTDRETLLRTSDFVSVNVPLNADTYHLIGKRELDMMKSTAILINTSRGPVVDEKALVDALNRGSIWGAGLDVYEREPEIDEGLKKLDNVVITPHIGSATTEARTKMALMAAKNIVAVLSGNKPINPVNHV
jgi:glyoxylate reductase